MRGPVTYRSTKKDRALPFVWLQSIAVREADRNAFLCLLVSR
jgi:hypothetical protein